MDRDWCAVFPYLPRAFAGSTEVTYRAVFGTLPLSAWTAKGSILFRRVNGKQLNFAARRTHCTIGFRGKDAVAFYRGIGGECPVGEVTIKLPHDQPFDSEAVQATIDWYFHN